MSLRYSSFDLLPLMCIVVGCRVVRSRYKLLMDSDKRFPSPLHLYWCWWSKSMSSISPIGFFVVVCVSSLNKKTSKKKEKIESKWWLGFSPFPHPEMHQERWYFQCIVTLTNKNETRTTSTFQHFKQNLEKSCLSETCHCYIQ